MPNPKRLRPNVTKQQNVCVGGVTPFTTIDFPGHLAAVVFCQGCPWRCGYCHNPHLLPSRPPRPQTIPTWPQLLDWMETRQGLLDGIVFSGGEPLLQRSLPQAITDVRQRGFAVALHTAGIYPERFAELLPSLDWVGFDIKAPFNDYRRITGVDSGHTAEKSLMHLLGAKTDYEVRCTVDTEVLNERDIEKLAQQLAFLGVNRLILQCCRRPLLPGKPQQNFLDAARTHLPDVQLREA